MVTSCSIALREHKFLVAPRPHWSDPNQFYVNIRSPVLKPTPDIVAMVNIADRTIAAATEPEVTTAVAIVTMYPLWQNNSWVINDVTDTLVIKTIANMQRWPEADVPPTWAEEPQYTITTFIGVLPGLNNINNIGVWYSARYQRVYVWYSTATMGDRIAIATLGDVGIIGTPAIYIPAPYYVYDYSTFSFGGPNRMYDIDGLFYMYFGAAGSAACYDHVYLRVNGSGIHIAPYASTMIDGSYPDNRDGTSWFVGVSDTKVIISPFDGSSSNTITFTQAQIDAIVAADHKPLDDKSSSSLYISTSTGKIVVGVSVGVGMMMVIAMIYMACRYRGVGKATTTNDGPTTNINSIVVRTTERQGSDSALVPVVTPVTYSQL